MHSFVQLTEVIPIGYVKTDGEKRRKIFVDPRTIILVRENEDGSELVVNIGGNPHCINSIEAPEQVMSLIIEATEVEGE